MWYSIIGDDAPNQLEQRRAARSAHLARLRKLQEQGRLLVAGPNPAIDSPDPGACGFTGSLIIAEFPSLEEAKSWANEDPYKKLGVYTTVTVKPFLKALP